MWGHCMGARGKEPLPELSDELLGVPEETLRALEALAERRGEKITDVRRDTLVMGTFARGTSSSGPRRRAQRSLLIARSRGRGWLGMTSASFAPSWRRCGTFTQSVQKRLARQLSLWVLKPLWKTVLEGKARGQLEERSMTRIVLPVQTGIHTVPVGDGDGPANVETGIDMVGVREREDGDELDRRGRIDDSYASSVSGVKRILESKQRGRREVRLSASQMVTR
ncbi:hypothetical protein H4582DRAFT_2064997 [Lactarius indigo]|nr:hypothetical protein H4582DRAFT_2064997 [Lactarius indigo]